MDEELKRYLDLMRQETAGSLAETRAWSERIVTETREHSERVAAQTRRHFDVVAERLRHEIQTVAEGVVANTERIERFSIDMKAEFSDVRSMIKFSHSELDRRITTLEGGFSELKTRVERLESSTQ